MFASWVDIELLRTLIDQGLTSFKSQGGGSGCSSSLDALASSRSPADPDGNLTIQIPDGSLDNESTQSGLSGPCLCTDSRDTRELRASGNYVSLLVQRQRILFLVPNSSVCEAVFYEGTGMDCMAVD